MFGHNLQAPITSKDTNGSILEVKEIFHTIQGEGPFAGRAAIFIRLAGCHLKCYFCDTDFENGQPQTVEEIMWNVANCVEGAVPDLVVITGGEPMRQNIVPLIDQLIDHGYGVQIETAGNLWVPSLEEFFEAGEDITIVCSPKTGSVHPKVAEYCRDWKYLTSLGDVDPVDGLPMQSTQVRGLKAKVYRPDSPIRTVIWLQPKEEYQEHVTVSPLTGDKQITEHRDARMTGTNIRLCGQLAMQYNYRVSLQTHKILELP